MCGLETARVSLKTKADQIRVEAENTYLPSLFLKKKVKTKTPTKTSTKKPQETPRTPHHQTK